MIQKIKRYRRRIFLIISIIIAAGIFAASSVPASGMPEGLGSLTTVAHFTEFTIFAVSLVLTVHGVRRQPWKTLVIAVVIASLYGVSDELHQLLVPGRQTDVFDWITDTAGAIVGAGAATLFIRVFPVDP